MRRLQQTKEFQEAGSQRPSNWIRNTPDTPIRISLQSAFLAGALATAATVTHAGTPSDATVNEIFSDAWTEPASFAEGGNAVRAKAKDDFVEHWYDRVTAARSSQPGWSSPLVTTTALLEQRVRFDSLFERSGNSTNTINIDGGRGVDLILSETNEVQIGAIPYYLRTSKTVSGQLAGFADWPFMRIKQRLASSPESEGNYVVSAWLQLQAPIGIAPLSNHAFTILPTLGFGKGWGPLVLQGTLGAVIPTAYEDKLGTQIVVNMALQYHLLGLLWPQIEVNWTYYPDGQRSGKNQVFVTPGIVVGRFELSDHLRFTFGVGYQFAVAPRYRPSPLIPVYDHAWIVTTRLTF